MDEKTRKYCDIQPYTLTTSQRIYVGIKAIIDFFVGLASLIFLAIPFCIIGIIIKLDSKGPVLFKSKKIGKDGKVFTFFKFRSMTTDASPEVATCEFTEQSKITRVGRILRKTSIDELPQILLMLTGKMSLIGYRPAFYGEDEVNNARDGFNMYQIRPGITGWAQINGRDVLGAHPKLKAQYDGYYLNNISLWLDIKIFFLTFFKIIKKSDIVEGNIEGLENNNQ